MKGRERGSRRSDLLFDETFKFEWVIELEKFRKPQVESAKVESVV